MTKQLTTLRAYVHSAKTEGHAKAPSDSALNLSLTAFTAAYDQMEIMAHKPGKHLTAALADLEAAIDDIEELVSRCETTTSVRIRGEDPPRQRR